MYEGAHLVKWQNAGEVPLVRKGRRRDDTLSSVTHHRGQSGRTTVETTMQAISQAWGQFGAKAVEGSGMGAAAEAQLLGNLTLMPV